MYTLYCSSCDTIEDIDQFPTCKGCTKYFKGKCCGNMCNDCIEPSNLMRYKNLRRKVEICDTCKKKYDNSEENEKIIKNLEKFYKEWTKHDDPFAILQ